MKKHRLVTPEDPVTEAYVKTCFQCPIELRDRLEDYLNTNNGYSPEALMNHLLSEALERLGY